MDAVRYPRVARYLGSLPRGLDSHPECEASASLYRQLLDLLPLGEVEPGALPAELVSLSTNKLPVSAWLGEARLVALFLAVADDRRMSDAEFLAANRDLNDRLLGGRFFKVLMSVASPSLLLAGAQFRWGAVHRGTRLLVERDGANGARVELTCPEGLYPELMLGCFGTAFEAALGLSNAKGGRVTLGEPQGRRAVFLARWD